MAPTVRPMLVVEQSTTTMLVGPHDVHDRVNSPWGQMASPISLLHGQKDSCSTFGVQMW